MTITIRNQQRKQPIDVPWLKEVLQTMLDALDYANFSLGVLLVNNERMREYNHQYRGKDYTTDILSFPFHEDLKAGERIAPSEDGFDDLGDLIIAPLFMAEDAPVRWDQTVDEHFVAMCAHGIAHLLQYDHQTDEDFEIMQKVERQLIKAVEKKKLIHNGQKRITTD